MIKRIILTLTATLACLAAAHAQISVPAGGTGNISFDTIPNTPADWATVSIAGAGNTYVGGPAVDTAALNVDGSTVNQALGSSATVPPSANAIARYNTALQALQSRPTGNAATILKATLRNATGGNVSALTVAYDFAVQSPATLEAPGLYVYWSLTGAPQSWTKIDVFSGHENSGTLTATLPVGTWANGTDLYIMWVDDNADTATDPSYTIDNISFTPGSATFAQLSSPTNNANFPQGFAITVSALAALPNSVTSVSFFDGATLIGTDTTAPFSITWNTASIGNHTLTAVASDGQGGSITSTNPVVIHVAANNAPVISALTNNLGVNTTLVGNTVTYTAVVTDDGAVTNVDFMVDGIHRWNDTTSPFQFSWSDITAGAHTISVVAKDNSGVSSTTSVSLSVTNPPFIDVLLANGSTWKYWDNGVEPSNGDWRQVGYDDSGWTTGLAEIGYGDEDANRPENTVSRKIVGTPGDPAAITNAAQLFRKTFNVAANPSAYTNFGLGVMVDDGAIVYINGVEVYRTANMVDPVTFGSYATATMAEDTYITALIPTDKIQVGENTIAVEVHQNSITSTDISFDVMVWGLKPVGPTLTIVKDQLDPNIFDIVWSGDDTLQASEDLSNPNAWFDIAPSEYRGLGPNGSNSFHVTLEPSSVSTYFRTIKH